MEIGVIAVIIVVGRILFNWFDGNKTLPRKCYVARRRYWRE